MQFFSCLRVFIAQLRRSLGMLQRQIFSKTLELWSYHFQDEENFDLYLAISIEYTRVKQTWQTDRQTDIDGHTTMHSVRRAVSDRNRHRLIPACDLDLWPLSFCTESHDQTRVPRDRRHVYQFWCSYPKLQLLFI